MISYRQQQLLDAFEGNFGRTFLWVVMSHTLVVFFLALSGYLQTPRRRPETMRVHLLEMPTPTPAPTPAVVAPEPALAPPPPEPAPPPPPKPEPAPAPPPPKPPPVKPPEPKAIVPPSRPKPEARPVPKPPEPTPEPTSTWKPRSAEEIRRSANMSRPQPRPTTPAVTSDQIEQRIRGSVSRLNVVSAPSTEAPRPDSAQTQRYFDMVGARLHAAWSQPTRAATGGGNPRVTVRLTVLPDGRVQKAAMIGNSGIMAMDASVAGLLRQLDRLPSYSAYGIDAASLDINVVFVLD